MGGRFLINPQKWNKYNYTINNPMIRIDPDGNDDFFIFRPEASSTSSAWIAIQNQAKELGHNVKIFNGAGDNLASPENYKKALATKDAHVVFSGHVLEAEGKRRGVLLKDGGVGDPRAVTAGGEVFKPVGDVVADYVTIIGCESTQIASQYGDTTYTGTDTINDLQAQEAGAATFTDYITRGLSMDQAVKATQKRMQEITDLINIYPGNEGKYEDPIVCTTVCTTVEGEEKCQLVCNR